MGEMIRARQEKGGSVLLAVEVDPAHVSNYGVFDIETTDDDRVKKVVGMVEKPAVEDAPSNLVATGRYLLDRKIFDALRRIKPGKGGEIQLTDALLELANDPSSGGVYGVVFRGRRYDTGDKLSYLKANVTIASEREDLGPELRAWLIEFAKGLEGKDADQA